MAGVKISGLPPIPSAPVLADIFPEVQPATGGTTYRTTFQQLLALFQPNIALINAGNPNGSVAGTAYQFLWDTTDSILWECTTTGSSSSAVWTKVGGSGAYLLLSGGTLSGILAIGSPSGGVNGSLTLYPTSASAGGFRILNNTVSSFSTTLTNTSVGQATILTLPDPGVAAANIALEVDNIFTPIVTCATPGDLSVAYVIQTGVYAKIGNLVTINARLQFTPTFTTASGEVQLAGLPFPVQSTNNIGWCGEISYMTGVMTWPAGLTSMSIIAEASGSFCGIWGKGAGINSSPILMSNLTSGVQYQFLYSVTYQN